MSIATKVRDLDWSAVTALYQLDPPLAVAGRLVDHVVVSTRRSVNGDHGSIVFAATAKGIAGFEPIHRTEATEHSTVLAELGYQVQS